MPQPPAASPSNVTPIEAADADGEARLGIQSLEIGMRLMAALVEHAFDNPPPMLKTLAAQAGMPPAKAHRYMVSLIRSRLVERDAASGRYRLGPMARLMGLRAIQSIDVVRLVSPQLPAICAELGFSVALSIWAYNGPTIIATEEARRPVTIGTRVGEVMPLLSSATGQVFGAWLPRAVTQELLDRNPGEAPVGAEPADALFRSVREAGMGVTLGGLNPTINALSAPLFDHRGALVAALSVLGPANELAIDVDSPVAMALRRIGAELSAALGHVPALTTNPF